MRRFLLYLFIVSYLQLNVHVFAQVVLRDTVVVEKDILFGAIEFAPGQSGDYKMDYHQEIVPWNHAGSEKLRILRMSQDNRAGCPDDAIGVSYSTISITGTILAAHDCCIEVEDCPFYPEGILCCVAYEVETCALPYSFSIPLIQIGIPPGSEIDSYGQDEVLTCIPDFHAETLPEFGVYCVVEQGTISYFCPVLIQLPQSQWQVCECPAPDGRNYAQIAHRFYDGFPAADLIINSPFSRGYQIVFTGPPGMVEKQVLLYMTRMKSLLVSAVPAEIDAGDSTTVYVQGVKNSDGDLFDPDPSTILVLHAANGLGSFSEDEITEVTYGEAHTNGVVYTAFGSIPEGRQTEHINVICRDDDNVGGSCTVGITGIPELHHLEVRSEKTEIAHQESTVLRVQGKLEDGTDFDPLDDTMILFGLDSTGARLGHLEGYDSTGVTYAYAKAGGVSFIADGEAAENLEKMKVSVHQMDDQSLRGEAELMVLGKEIKLKILDPDTVGVDTLWITSAPSMPIDTCKAVLLNHMGGDVTFNWKYKVRYELPRGDEDQNLTREDSLTFEYTSMASNSDTTTQIIDFLIENDTTFIGGKVTIYLEAITSDSVFQDTLANEVLILGRNPTPQNAREYSEEQQSDIKLQMGVTMWWESRYMQYFIDGRMTCDNRNEEFMPLFGPPDGRGVCQIEFSYKGTELCDDAEKRRYLWNWQDNIQKGIAMYNEKAGIAGSYVGQVRVGSDIYSIPGDHTPDYHIIKYFNKKTGSWEDYHGGFPGATDFTDEQMQTDTYQLYQGYHYYIWRLNDPQNIHGSGEWVPRLDPNHQYMTGDDRYRIHQQVENADKGIGTYPEGWNDTE